VPGQAHSVLRTDGEGNNLARSEKIDSRHCAPGAHIVLEFPLTLSHARPPRRKVRKEARSSTLFFGGPITETIPRQGRGRGDCTLAIRSLTAGEPGFSLARARSWISAFSFSPAFAYSRPNRR
jgi:hypothetical protein